MNARGMLVIVTLSALWVACTPTHTTTPQPPAVIPSATLSPTATASPTPTPRPTTLTICMGAEPASLYLYQEMSHAARLIYEAIYDGPIDTVGYTYRPVILEKLPSLADGDAVIETTTVQAGDAVIDDNDEVVTLVEGRRVRPAGCRAPDCAITFDGAPLEMDRMQVTFRLKSGVRWADGEPLTARDSAYSFTLARDPATPNAKWREMRTAAYVATDALTAVWTGLPGFLDAEYPLAFWTPLPEHAWGDDTAAEMPEREDVIHTPLGYGPYAIQKWVPGQYLRAPRNPAYFRAAEGLPVFDEVVFRFFGNQDVDDALDALTDGRCDFLTLETYPERGLERLQAMDRAGEARLYATPGTAWEHLTFNVKPPEPDRPAFFADARTRQAVALCIDRRRIAVETLCGLSVVPDTYVPPDHPLYAATEAIHYAFDPAQGRALLDEAGWRDEDGDGVREAHGVAGVADGAPFRIRYATTTMATRRQIADRIAADLAACGITVETAFTAPQEMYAQSAEGVVYGRRFDVVQFSWLTWVMPPCELYLSTDIPGEDNQWDGSNVGGYADPAYDDACTAALAALPGEAAYQAAHREAQRIFSRDLPALPLFQRMWIYASRPDLQGVIVDPIAVETWNLEAFELGH